jgi:hypothetical protein
LSTFSKTVFRSRPIPGSFEDDNTKSKFTHSWETPHAFEHWLAEEERTNCIELSLVKKISGLPAFEVKYRYVCSRRGTGGVKAYEKKCPGRSQQLADKQTWCECALTIKQYPGWTTMLGDYSNEHNHTLGNGNLAFTRIPKKTREHIAGLLRLKVAPDHIVCISFSRNSSYLKPSAVGSASCRDLPRGQYL